ncbi:MAG: hypothetical protein JRN39_03660 [Nitrososphaerota archaeon]|nr:hypothetical protein [Nitrososphaerota archaeon]MDG6939480.1 hypothetical protein [Nitrososphaerota archaeon]
MSEPSRDDSVRLLLNPNLALRQKPWDVSIHLLLQRFLDFLMERPIMDMRLSGLALLTSSIIYKLKVEQLFYEEGRTARKRVSDLEEPVEVLRMPFRLQPPVSDMSDLISALESLLREMEKPTADEHDTSIFRPALEAQVIEKDTITEVIQEYSVSVLERLRDRAQLGFSELAAGADWVETVRLFIVILFLAHQGKVVLTQEEDGDILIAGVG